MKNTARTTVREGRQSSDNTYGQTDKQTLGAL